MGECLAIQKSDIKPTGNTIEDMPKYYYLPVLRGQTVYILDKCKSEGIRVEFTHGKIYIYSERKVQRFQEIILNSFSVNFIYTVDDMKKSSQHFHQDKRFICLALKELDTILTVEQAFDRVIYYQFLGKIPVAKNYRIFSTYRELIEQAAEEFNIIF